ncbi:MAG TPA: ABC transporter substrate-binding protein [Clostridia bacterium]|nr:ABC transporter substrate-binding protein [Clostridia bacterium]
MLKKLIALILACAMVSSLAACSGGSSTSSAGSESSKAAGSAAAQTGGKTKITILGTLKDEVAEPFKQEMAEYNKSQDKYEISSIPLDGTAMQKLTTLYASGNAPTIFTSGQEASTFKDKLMDLSKVDQIKQAQAGTTELMTDKSGKVFGMPLTVEAFGILYNKKVLDKAVGGTFDPSTINTQDALKDLLAKVAKTGVSADRVSGVDWSLGAHMTNLMFTTQNNSLDKNLQFMDDLKNGKVDLASNKVYNGWLDTVDLLLANNASKKSPLAPTYDDDILAFAKEKTGLWFQGNWAFPMIQKANSSADVGIMPFPISNNPSDYGNTQISVGASQYFCVDASQSTKEQQAGALDFINWFFTSKTGQDYYVNKLNFIPAYKNITATPSDNLSKMVVKYMNDNKTLSWINMYYPGDGVTSLGAIMQKYVAGKADRKELAKELQTYWTSKKS